MKPLDHRTLGGSVESRPDARAGGEDFRAILESIPQMVWAHLPGLDQHEYYNRQWLEFTGVPLEPDGSTRRRLIHPDDRERAMSAWRRALAAGEPYQAEYRLRHRSGEYRWILSRGRPERNDAGEIVRWYGTCTDIHALILAREALHASETLNRSIIQASADCIKMIDADGTIRFANAAALRELGAACISEVAGLLKSDRQTMDCRSCCSIPPLLPTATLPDRSSLRCSTPYRLSRCRRHWNG